MICSALSDGSFFVPAKFNPLVASYNTCKDPGIIIQNLPKHGVKKVTAKISMAKTSFEGARS